jgi:sensor histidine kinase YesM
MAKNLRPPLYTSDPLPRTGGIVTAQSVPRHGAENVSRAHGWSARTFRGFTWKRFAVFCAIVGIAALGHAVGTYLAPGKTLSDGVQAFVHQCAHLFIFFGTVWGTVVAVGNWAPARTGPRVLTLAGAVAAGLVIGNLLTVQLMATLMPMDKDAPTLLKEISGVVLWSHVIAAGVLGYYFLTREEEAAARLHREEMQRIELDRELAEARMQVMQAQVEPHFLFNTLANVRRLFQTDPPAARAMLEHLSRYLSAMLPRMRSRQSTLGQELALALAYLHVQQIRMGSRLEVRTDVPAALEVLPFPPMMLVTLVENAIRHGINPLPKGGEVRIVARIADGKLRLQVVDTGRGLSESTGSGVGLANIGARLSTLYGSQARLLLMQNPARGVIATIELPSAMPVPAAQAA